MKGERDEGRNGQRERVGEGGKGRKEGRKEEGVMVK